MPLSFAIISIANITDPNEALVDLGSSVDANGGNAGLNSPVTFATLGDVDVTIDENVLTDDAGGGATLSAPVTINSVTYAAGSKMETDYSFVALDPATNLYFMVSHVTINNTYVGAVLSRGFDRSTDDFGDVYTPGNTLNIINPDAIPATPGWVTFTQGEEFNTGQSQLYDNDIDVFFNDALVICFARGTRILCADGLERRIETLSLGDRIETFDGGPRPIAWIGSTRVDAQRMATHPELRPVRIRAGALSPGLPRRDLVVSRQHRMMVSSPIAARMFGSHNVLVSALRLVGLPGIAYDTDLKEVEYFHMLFADHEVVFAEGAPSESLFTGAEALKAVTPAARTEIFTLFPELRDTEAALARPPAYPIPEGRRQRRLIGRHDKNRKPLIVPPPAAKHTAARF